MAAEGARTATNRTSPTRTSSTSTSPSRQPSSSGRRAPAVRTTPARSRAVAAPRLRVVASRRRAARVAAVVGVTVFAVLIGVTILQTRIAQNQLELDTVDRSILSEREEYDQLRLLRAELLAPERLMAEAVAAGMVPGSATVFVPVSGRVIAEVAVVTSGLSDRTNSRTGDQLRDYADLKSTVEGAG